MVRVPKAPLSMIAVASRTGLSIGLLVTVTYSSSSRTTSGQPPGGYRGVQGLPAAGLRSKPPDPGVVPVPGATTEDRRSASPELVRALVSYWVVRTRGAPGSRGSLPLLVA